MIKAIAVRVRLVVLRFHAETLATAILTAAQRREEHMQAAGSLNKQVAQLQNARAEILGTIEAIQKGEDRRVRIAQASEPLRGIEPTRPWPR